MGVATDCSTATASAPGYCDETLICGGVISGNCAMGSRIPAIAPPRTKGIARGGATDRADPPAQHEGDRQDDGHDGPVDEELGHDGNVSFAATACRRCRPW